MKLIKQENTRRITLQDRILNRKKVLMIRKHGGLGDIFMLRMLYREIKRKQPNCHLTVAIPEQYREAVSDLWAIDDIVDVKKVEKENYGIWFDTSHACLTYEMKKAPYSDKHRSDIWASHCGFTLDEHEMDFRLDDGRVGELRNKLEQAHKKKIVLLSPISAMVVKNLLPHQIRWIKEVVDDHNMKLIASHTSLREDIMNMDIPMTAPSSISEFIHIAAASDYIISVDTALFHLAGGLKKPLTGIFTFADGKIYGQYYKFTLVQKHRDNGNWDCGPCYAWCNCPKSQRVPKPCLTELTESDIKEGVNTMLAS